MKRGPMKPGKPLARGTARLTTTRPLQRTGSLKQGGQLARTAMKASTKPMAAVGQRAKRMRQGKVAPTAQEAAWMAAISQFCIVCHLQHGTRAPAEIHHLKDGDRRIGHLHSIGLCTAHHRGGAGSGPFISRHPWKARFEAAYGAELELLAALRQLLNFTPAL